MTWVRIPPGAAHFFFEKKRKRTISVGGVVLPCLSLNYINMYHTSSNECHTIGSAEPSKHCKCIDTITYKLSMWANHDVLNS